MPNPPPVWDQYYPGGVHQQAADWNEGQHEGIAKDPGTLAGPTGPTGPVGIAGPTGSVGAIGPLGPTGTVPSGSGRASFRAVLSTDQPLGSNPSGVVVNFNTPLFQNGNYLNLSTHTWSPPAGVVFLHAQCLVLNLSAQFRSGLLAIYKNGSPLSDSYRTLDPTYGFGTIGASIQTSVIDICSGSDTYDVRISVGQQDSPSVSGINQSSVFIGTLLA
jgi:hypothetical protein